VTGSRAAAAELRCSTCGQSYGAFSWTELPTVRILTSAEVHEHVTTWPEEMVVAVRTCRGCGAPMARTAQHRIRPFAVERIEPVGR
jgi:hypothetical protein